MSNEITKEPEIRFDGYEGDWEQHKLGDILSERKIRSKISKEIPLLAFAAGQGVIDRSERKTNNRDFLTKDANTKTYLLTKYNDIVYNPSNLKYGAIDRNKYGLGVISPIYATFETNQVPEFIELIVTSYSFKQRALQYEEGTVTKRQSVKPENLLTLDVSISKTLEEQQKIGTFFQQLDNTIALHQRELDLLEQTKQTYLQKMFPKTGEDKPEIRFAGFTDAWEERKLKDILREFSTKSKIENEYRVLSSTNVGMELRDGRVSGTSNLGYKIIKNGDLVLSPQNLWLGNININNIGTGLVSPSYKTFNFTDIDSSFIKPQLRTPKMLEEYKNSSTQGASVVRRNLEIDSFYQIKIATPSIKEQEKIGSFFKQLDDTIALHQRKLDSLKEMKKTLLQKMFV
ncbi:restriction endonuclease subunit S [Enterococcus hirae]|uniref:restriction endonuclease subunit S n=1 Tax=Enterococcus hirae TaxID=1354 RepID=UPI0015F26D60|nr:restriction endonuclease subunit S [Enterococcus hirae]MBA5264933.1 restriction endonuclease subunit S [Enterococcus hirae]